MEHGQKVPVESEYVVNHIGLLCKQRGVEVRRAVMGVVKGSGADRAAV